MQSAILNETIIIFEKLNLDGNLPEQGIFVVINIKYTIYNIQYTIYNTQYTIYNIQYTIYNIQYTYSFMHFDWIQSNICINESL